MSGYLWAVLSGLLVSLLAYFMGRRRGKAAQEATDAHGAAKAKREALVDALGRKDDDTVQREAMQGIKPLKPGRGK